MIGLVLLVVLLVIVAVLAFGRPGARARMTANDSNDPIRSEDELQAQVGLHEARRRLDVAWLKHQAEAESARLRRELDRALQDWQ